MLRGFVNYAHTQKYSRQILDPRQVLYPLKKFIDQRWNFINLDDPLDQRNFLTHTTHVRRK